MVISGHASINIFKYSVELVLNVIYTDSLGRHDSMLHYYRIEYGNRLFRWFLSDIAIEQFKDIIESLGLELHIIYDYRVIVGENNLKNAEYVTRIFLDNKEDKK